MAVISLDDNQSRTQYFHNVVLINLTYWQDWLDAVEDRDVEELDGERDNVVKAITLALDLGKPAWPVVHQLLIAFSPYMERRGQWGIWNTILHQAVSLADQAGDDPKRATLLALLARLLYRQSRFQESIAVYRQTIRVARKIDDPFEEARACTNLGFFFIEQGYWYRAEVLCCHALTIFSKIGSQHGMAHTNNHLGFLYTQKGHYDKAQHHLAKACAIWQDMEDDYGLMLGSMNFGVLYVYRQMYDEALTYSKNALELANRTGEKKELGAIYTNIGMAYLKMGNLSEARRNSLKAEEICRRFFDRFGLAEVQENLGKVYLGLKDYEAASWYLETALNTWIKTGNRQGEIQTRIYLTEFELARGNGKLANDWLAQAEILLKQQAESAGYRRMQSQVKKIRHSLDSISS
jgi:tetratricopeptide (TPR) repeat protein